MGIENDTDEFPQLRSELTDAERQAADQGALDAFRQAFGDETPAVHTPAVEKTEAADVKDAGEKTGDISTEDPFKDYPADVRDRLADAITLKRDHDALKGRLAPTQQKLSKVEKENAELRRQLADREAASAPSPALEKVRGELPEVADAIEEAVQRSMKRSAPVAEEVEVPATRTEEAPETLLAKVHPDWAPTINSTDYKLWTASRGDDYLNQVQTSNDPVFMATSLTEFKARKPAVQREVSDADRRQQRAAAAVTPNGRPAPAGSDALMTELEAAAAAFNSP